MKIIFASDMSFNYIPAYPGDAAVRAAMAEPAALFSQADFSVVNLENIFGDASSETPIIKSGPNLISSPDYMEYLLALRPTAVGLANNHAGDFGDAPLLFTKKTLEEHGMTAIGAGVNLEEAYRPALFEKDGIRAAVIAVCENEFGSATASAPGSAGYNITRITRAIHTALREGYLPIIYFHGGNEYDPFPSPGKSDLYRHFIDLGAAAVIAMHTHCPQGYEIYDGKPIVYSMGNFFFPSSKASVPVWFCGYMSELNITEAAVTLNVHPYVFDFDSIRLLNGAEKEEFLAYLDCLNAPLNDPAELQEYFDSWCLTSSYTKILTQYTPALFADGHTAEIKSVKNIFGCEAHNELIRNTMFMIYESRVESARARLPIIRKLQNMERI